MTSLLDVILDYNEQERANTKLAGRQPPDFEDMIAKTVAQLQLFLARASTHGDVEDTEYDAIAAAIPPLEAIKQRIEAILAEDNA